MYRLLLVAIALLAGCASERVAAPIYEPCRSAHAAACDTLWSRP